MNFTQKSKSVIFTGFVLLSVLIVFSACKTDISVVNTFYVTYDANAGENTVTGSVEKQSAKEGESVTVAENAFEIEDKVFIEWNTKADGSGDSYKPGDSITLNSDITLFAQWQNVAYYSVTFDTDGGGSIEAQSIRTGSKATKPENPEKTGFTFKYWKLGDSEFNFDTPITQEITLVAEWEIIKYSVTYKIDNEIYTSQQIDYNTKAEKPAEPEKRGHTFQYWMLGNEEFNFDTLITDNIELTAYFTINSYKVSFISEGVKVADVPVVYNNTVSAPAENPKKTGHTFQYWMLGNAQFNFDTPITDNIELTAYFTINSYKVSFISEGVKVDEAPVVYNNTVSAPAENPKKTGHTFQYWKLGNEEFNFDTPITDNIELTAYFTINSYKVSFVSEGIKVDEAPVVYNNTVSAPSENPKKTGHTFQYWMLGNEEFNFDTPITDNIELTAYFTINSYKVSFVSEGVKVDEASVDYNNTVSAPAENPKKTGYTFQYWMLGNEEFNFDTPITDNIELTAYFTINLYKVSFISEGVKVDEASVVYNNTVSAPAENPKKTGYTFQYWMLGNAQFNFDTPITDNIELTAYFTINSYKVSFVSDGVKVDEPSVDYNNTVSAPAENPKKTGHTFQYWKLGNEEFNFDTPITGPIELTAYYTINTYKVEFVVDDVKVSETLVVYNNLVDEADKPETPINDAKIFDCWYFNNAPFDFASDPILDNTLITAHWKIVPENNVVVTYKDENLNILSQTFAPKNTIIQPISVAGRDGYSFMGWLNGENIFDFTSDTLSENTVFIQKWEPNILLFQVTLESFAGNNTIELIYDEASRTFTAADGYTNYIWKIDGRVLQGANSRSLILTDYDSQIETGRRQLLLNAKKDGKVYSASATITMQR